VNPRRVGRGTLPCDQGQPMRTLTPAASSTIAATLLTRAAGVLCWRQPSNCQSSASSSHGLHRDKLELRLGWLASLPHQDILSPNLRHPGIHHSHPAGNTPAFSGARDPPQPAAPLPASSSSLHQRTIGTRSKSLLFRVVSGNGCSVVASPTHRWQHVPHHEHFLRVCLSAEMG
jgi:hypothetical protein